MILFDVASCPLDKKAGRDALKLISQVTNQLSDNINFSVCCGFGTPLSVLEPQQLFCNLF